MKAKITYYTLMFFIMSAESCGVDTGRAPLHLDPLPAMEIMPEIPEPVEPPFHIYTEEEQQQIYRNTMGRYRSVDGNRVSILEIREDGYLLEIIERTNEQHQYPYNIAFPINQPPFLAIDEDVQREMTISFNPNNRTEVIGLLGTEDEEDILGDVLGYYQKLPNHQDHAFEGL